MNIFAPSNKDAYKIGHKDQYAKGTTLVYSNLTARSGKHSNVNGSTGIIFVGLQYVILNTLIDNWNKTFFEEDKDVVIEKYKRLVSGVLGYSVDVEHMAELHDLGYLPVEIRALPEGSFVPYQVPMLTIHNTLDGFYWVTNMLETMLSAELWMMITSATTYNQYRKNFEKYAKLTGAPLEGVPFQGHDFSMRGMANTVAGAMSGFATLAAGSYGTDSLPAIQLAEEYYGANMDDEIIGMSVNATEHSVMCSNGKDDEIGTFRRLITETYPTGIVSIVSDTWDLWRVVSDFLPALKSEILGRDGKLVIRPDSGDPVDILCGKDFDIVPETMWRCWKEVIAEDLHFIVSNNTPIGQCEDFTNYYCVGDDLYKATYSPDQKHTDSNVVDRCTFERVEKSIEDIGLIEALWNIFGGSINEKGFKVLHPNIGAIYGDSITLERQEAILSRLKKKGFSSGNVVLGVGSYTYQHVTRDTHGMAVKSTYVEIDGKGVDIFKDPKTDGGMKKSAKGLLMVTSHNDGELIKFRDQVTWDEAKRGALETVFLNGKLVKKTTLAEIRERVMRVG